jgi:adenosine deaminase
MYEREQQAIAAHAPARGMPTAAHRALATPSTAAVRKTSAVSSPGVIVNTAAAAENASRAETAGILPQSHDIRMADPILAALPKIELHLHLDCSMSYAAIRQLVPGLSLDDYYSSYVAPERCTDLAHFLECSCKGVQLLQDESALKLVVQDIFEQFQADNVIYAELRFAPLLHIRAGLTPERVVEIVNEATDRMGVATGIEARLILCTLRHFDERQSMSTAELAHAFQATRVVGIDIAGDEAGFPLVPHIDAFKYAQQHNLFRTAHAGEAAGPQSVWDTLEHLNPMRIGHGIRSIEDATLIQHLREKRIHLEVCPSSNVQIVPSIEDFTHHPIDRLYRSGVPVSINTDTRMLTPTTLTREYEHVHGTFDWSLADFHRTNLLAVDAAFLDEPTRQRLRDKINRAYEQLARL